MGLQSRQEARRHVRGQFSGSLRCVADEPVYSLMVGGSSLNVVDESGDVVGCGPLDCPVPAGALNSYSTWTVLANKWQEAFGIHRDETYKAVLDYYHKKFCGDSAGEVDGE